MKAIDMTSFSSIVKLCVFSLLACSATALLSPSFYGQTCPNLQNIVRSEMTQVVHKDPRMAASVLRLHQLDCLVDGCDASDLLDDTDSFVGEKNAAPNKNSARGFEVVDDIKARVEADCPGTVSCADILALTARDSVVLLGGPSWTVSLGRRDARTASQSAANSQIPSPSSDLATLISMFEAKGLSARDMTALSGAHTIGQVQCKDFRPHIYNDTNIDTTFASLRKSSCSPSGGDTNMSPLDSLTPLRFDNSYYRELVARRGLLHSDQVLFNGGSQDALVRLYSENSATFFRDFAAAMVKMGNISPLTGTDGEIRKNCRVVN